MTPARTARRRLGVPAYFLPGAAWEALCSPAVGYVILNPASGAGTAPHAGYAAAIAMLRWCGIKVLGYVPTSHGHRAPCAVQDEIDRYRHWYGVDGIFLDETASHEGALAYYRDLAAYSRTGGALIVALNPGVFPAEPYANLADLLGVFEGDFAAYQRVETPAWIDRHPREKFWHLVYDTSPAELPAALRLASARRAGSVYVTDLRLPNPWGGLPSYWSAEVGMVLDIHPPHPDLVHAQ